MSPPTLLACATEISGDARGARLAIELRRRAPHLEVCGLGGDRMRRAGVDVGLDITGLGTVGWFDHWRELPRYLSALRFWRREIRERRPLAAMVIDAPGISYPFARVARAAGLPVIYFVTPQTWLWNPVGTVARLRAHADIVVPSLDREADIYIRGGLSVVYEGHPALDDLVEARDRAENQRSRATADAGRQDSTDGKGAAALRTWAPAGGTRVGIVPGSRRHAVARLLPAMLDALDLLDARLPLGDATVSLASALLRPQVESALATRSRPVRCVEQDLWQVLTSADVVLASTGGNLLDAVFADVPAVAAYRVDAATYWIARHVMRLDERLSACALPNLIAGNRFIPELIQRDVTAAQFADAAARLLTDENARESIRRGYATVRASLGRPGVNGRIAARLLKEMGVSAGPRARSRWQEPPLLTR